MKTKSTGAISLSHHERVSSVLDKWLFFIAFVIGAIGIIGLKQLGFSQIVATGWPLTVMVLYFAHIIATNRFQLREDIAGDNLYYLGFLYTLTSLSCALYQFTQEKGGTEAITSNFGIALTTTILGLVFRVVLYQMRQDPVEIEREARIELGEAARRLKHELDDVVVEMNSFRRGIQQSIDEGMKEIANLAQGELIKTIKNVGRVANGVVLKVDEAFDSFTKNAQQINKVTANTVNALQNMIKRIESIEVPEKIIEEKLEPAVEGIGQVVEELKTLAKEDQKVVRRLSRMIEKAGDATELLDGRIDAINKQMEPLHGAITRITEMGESLKDIKAATEAVLNGIKKTVEEQESILTGIRETAEKKSKEATDSMLRVINNQGDAIGEVLTISKENAETILKQARTNAESQTRVLDALVSTMEKNLETVRGHNKAIEYEFKRARAVTIRVQAALASMSDLLIKKLGSPDEERDKGFTLRT
ncbi:hypothetical protein ACFL6B_03200 [Thermodesulfobacteriota bacterium]